MKIIIKLDKADITTRILGVNTEIEVSPALSIVFSSEALDELLADRQELLAQRDETARP